MEDIRRIDLLIRQFPGIFRRISFSKIDIIVRIGAEGFLKRLFYFRKASKQVLLFFLRELFHPVVIGKDTDIKIIEIRLQVFGGADLLHVNQDCRISRLYVPGGGFPFR